MKVHSLLFSLFSLPIIWLLWTGLGQLPKTTISAQEQVKVQHTTVVCDPREDSLTLVRLFDTLGGRGWNETNGWLEAGVPIGEWEGVCAPSCVIQLDLDGDLGLSKCNDVFTENPAFGANNLKGKWPTSFCLPQLEELSISENKEIEDFTIDPICFPVLRDLYAENVGITRGVFEKILEIQSLEQLSITNNRKIKGNITPDIREKLPNINGLGFGFCGFSGPIPLIGPPTHVLSYFDVSGNNYTFEDILPYLEFIKGVNMIFDYGMQAKIFQEMTYTVGEGLPFSIDLGIDEAIETNIYKWSKDGSAFRTVEGSNKLTFDSVLVSHEGVYTVKVTNPLAPDLTLYSHPITIKTCTPSTESLEETVCFGEPFIWKDRAFFEDTLIIFRGGAVNGCDSAIIVDLKFPDTRSELDTVLCPGEVLIVGGKQIAEKQTRTIVLPGVGINGCDSLVDVNIRIAEAPDFPAAEVTAYTVACDSTISLNANLPPETSGEWKADPGLSYADSSNTTIHISGLIPGDNIITWYLSTEGCAPYSSAVAIICYEPELINAPNIFEVAEDDSLKMVLPVSGNTLWCLPDYEIQLLTEPDRGTITPQLDGQFIYQPEEGALGDYTFEYQLLKGNCPPETATATITVRPSFNDIQMPPNVITPNGDGYNDVFVIPEIYYNPANFPDSELYIYSKNGKRLVHFYNYQNTWGGVGKRGQQLPEGIYYFYLDYGDPNYKVHKGSIKIIRSSH